MDPKSPHLSVLLNEVLEAFEPCHLDQFIDGTTGAGGHAEALLKYHPEIKRYSAFDQDLSALDIAKKRLDNYSNVEYFHQNFSNIGQFFEKSSIDGILVDIGVSSMQLDQSERGFSFQKEGPLDMRMDQTQPLTAYEIVNHWTEEELGRIFWQYGEERYWKKVAYYICKTRQEKKLETTSDLKEVLNRTLGRKKEGIDPATRVFQAIRIAVNGELEHLELFLKAAVSLLKPKGRLAVISFHSLEDRIVKRYFQELASDKVSSVGSRGLFVDKKPEVLLVSRKAIVASEAEIELNRRSRSAKMRVIEKI